MATSSVRIAYAGQCHARAGEELQAGLASALKCALDYLREGVIVVDRAACVVFANREGLAILDAHDGLHAGLGGLRAETSEQTSLLRREVEAAAVAPFRAASGAFALSRRSRPHPLSVVVEPLRPQGAGALGDAALALVLVVDPDRAPTPSANQLRQLYGLTDAEATVAVAVMRGEGLPAVATELNVGLTTARTHLQHVFEKTGTRRQAELVRLILANCVGVRGGRDTAPDDRRPNAAM